MGDFRLIIIASEYNLLTIAIILGRPFIKLPLLQVIKYNIFNKSTKLRLYAHNCIILVLAYIIL